MFEYFVGVCVAPVSTPLTNCYVVQRITSPNGDVSLHCLGGNVDVQVTDTKGTLASSVHSLNPQTLKL